MGIFGRGKGIQNDEKKDDGLIICRITYTRIDRKKAKVKAFAVDRTAGETVFKLRFSTNKNGLAAYYESENQLKEFAKNHNYVIDHLTTNIDLPFVRTIDKKAR